MPNKIKGKQIAPNFIETVTAPQVEADVKHFRIKHPTQEGMTLVYTCIEGPENAVFFRGRTTDLTITLPDHWEHLVDENTITVHLTPIGYFSQIYLLHVSSKKITVGVNYIGTPPRIEYSYLVMAERKDIPKLEVVQPEPLVDESET